MDIFERVKQELKSFGLSIASFDFERPWGGFFVIEENQAQDFADVYFEGFNVANLRISGKLSPKILMVKPSARLSWQYHNRRAETWRVVSGPVGVIKSNDDREGEINSYETGEIIVLNQGERHRLIGLNDWGIVAEFWQHTDLQSPSDEFDIIRVQDDYLRD
jgi:mannose-6-phosphate isomerase-like protein (cupin superfamily)